MKWFDPIIMSLQEEVIETKLPVKTRLDGIYLPEKKLFLHFISMNQLTRLQLPENYFAHLSDEAQSHQLKCIHLWEDIYTHTPQIVIERLLAMVGTRKRIHGRATEVKRIDKKTADNFLKAHHLQKAVAAYYKFGLYHQQQLVAVATFSKSRVMHDSAAFYRSYELIRFASASGVTVTGGLSKLLAAFVQEVNPAHIMTYADRDWGLGEGYEKLGFKLTETIPPIPFFINPLTMERFPVRQENEISTTENLVKVYNSGSYKFILDRRH